MTRALEAALLALRRAPGSPAALDAVRQACRASPASTEGLRAALDRARADHAALEDWALVVALYEAELALTTDAGRRVELLLAAAQLLEDELLEETRALAYYDEAAALRPDDAPLRARIERVRLVRDNAPRVADKLAEEAASAVDRPLKARLWHAAAEVVARNDPAAERVERYLRASLEVDPHNGRAWGQLERWMRRAERAAELLELLELRRRSAVEPAERLVAWLKLGECWADQAALPPEPLASGRRGAPRSASAEDQAVACWRQVLLLDPSQPCALARLARALEQRRDWEGLAESYQAALRHGAATERDVELLAQLGHVLAIHLGQRERAEECFRLARRQEPEHPLVLEFFCALHRERGESAEELALLEQAQRRERDPRRRLELAVRRAELAEQVLGDLDRAIEIWSGLAQAPAPSAAAPAAAEEPLPGLRQRARDALARLYRQSTPPRWNALRELRKAELDELPPDATARQIELLLEIAAIYRDHLKQETMVVSSYGAVLALQPDHVPTLVALSETLARMQRWSELVDVLARRAVLSSEPAARAALLHEIAALWLERLDNPTQAIPLLEQLLQLEQRDARARALLRAIHTRRHNWRALFELLTAEAALREGPARVALLAELARLAAEQLGEPSQAASLWRELLQLDPQHAEALAALAPIYRAGGDWVALGDVLQARLELVEPQSEAALELWEQLADLYSNQLRTPERAIVAWREVLARRPATPRAVVLLRELLAQERRWDELEALLAARGLHADLVETLSSAADRERDEETRVELGLRVGQLCAAELKQTERAIRAYERVAVLRPGDLRSARALAPLYRATRRWEGLVRADERLLEQTTDHAERRALLTELQQLCERQLGDPARALQWAARAWQAAPGEPALRDEVERLARLARAWRPLAELLEQQLVQLDAAAPQRLPLVVRLAELWAQELADGAVAERYYREWLRLRGDDRAAWDGLVRIYRAAGRWRELLEALEALAALPLPGVERATLVGEVAVIAEERLGDLGVAMAAYRRLLSLGVERAPVLQALERLCRVSGAWSELAAVLREQLERTGASDPGRADLLCRLATVVAEREGDPDQAIALFGQALALVPDHPAAVTALMGWMERSDAPQRARAARLLLDHLQRVGPATTYAAALAAACDAETDLRLRRDLLRRLQRVQEQTLRQPAEALVSAETLLRLDPGDETALADLLRLARSAGQSARAAALLTSLLSGAGLATAAGSALRWQLVQLLQHELADSAAAQAQLVTLVADQPQHVAAAALLEDLLGESGQWRELRALLQARAGRSDDRAEGRRLLLQVCALDEDVLGEPDAAVPAYEQLWRWSTGDGEAFRGLERHYRRLERWSDLAQLYRTRREVSRDPAERQALLLRGAALEEQLGQLAEASASYRQLALDPEHLGLALRALERLYGAGERWRELVEVLRQQTALASSAEARVELWRRIASIARGPLADRDEAMVALRALLAERDDDAAAADELAELCAATGQWRELAQLLERGAQQPAVDAAQRMDRWFRLARLRATHLDDVPGALEAYRAVLALRPGHAAARAALDDYLEQPSWAPRAAEILAPLQEAAGDWRGLMRSCEVFLAHEREPARRRELCVRLARLWEEQLGDPQSALAWYGKAHWEEPEHEQARAELLRLAAALVRWPEVLAVLAQPLDEGRVVGAAGRTLALLVGRLNDERLYQWQPAAACFERVLAADRTDDEAFKLLERLLMRHERWQELLAVYARLFGELSADDAEAAAPRRELLLKGARVWEEALNDFEGAIAAYRSLLQHFPGDETALNALERLFRERQQWPALCGLLQQRIDSAAVPAERLDLLCRLGALYEQQLGDLASAIDSYQGVLAADPSHTQAVAGLERIVLDRNVRFRVAQLLESAYRARDEWAKLVVVLDVQLDFVDDQARRNALLREIAALHEQRGGIPELALKALGQAFREGQGADGELLAQLEALAGRIGAWSQLLGLLYEVIDAGGEVTRQCELLARAARLAEERLGAEDAALAAWRRLLTLREHDGEARAAVLRLLEQLARWEPLTEALQREAELTSDVALQRRCQRRIAEIFEQRLGWPVRAIEAWREVLALGGEDELALEALALLYARAERWTDLVWVYQRQLAAAVAGERWRAIGLAIARTLEQRLGDSFGAAQTLRQLYERAPADAEIGDQLERLLAAAGLWGELLVLIDGRAATEREVAGVRQRRRQAVEVLLDRLGDEAGAVRRLEELLTEDPQDEAALALLERLVASPRPSERVAALLERVTTARGDRLGVQRALELLAAAVPAGPQRREVLVRLALLQEQELGDPRAALGSYQRAALEDPSDETPLVPIERLARELGVSDQLRSFYEGLVGQVYEPAANERLHVKLATLAEAAGDAAAAERHYRAAIERQGGTLRLWAALAALFEAQGRVRELVDALERQCDLTLDLQVRAGLHHRIGEILINAGAVEGAFAAWGAALSEDARNPGARAGLERLLDHPSHCAAVLDVLEPIYEAEGDYVRLVALGERRVATVSDRARQALLLDELARLQEEQLEQPAAAFATLLRALRSDATRPARWEEAGRLAVALGRPAELEALLDQLLGAPELAPELARELGLRSAAWQEDQLGDGRRAEARYRWVLERHPRTERAWLALERAYRAHGDARALSQLLWQRLPLLEEQAERRRVLSDLGRLSAEELGDERAAIVAWRTLLAHEPDHAGAFAALTALCHRTGEWRELVATLDQRARASNDPAEARELALRAARTLLEQLDEREGAALRYRELLRQDPGCAAALLGLQRVAERSGDWAAARELVLRRRELSSDPAERRGLTMELATLCEDRLGDAVAAERYFHEALTGDALDDAAFAGRARLLRQQRRWSELAELQEARLSAIVPQGASPSAIGTSAEALELRLELARLCLDELAQPERAQRCLGALEGAAADDPRVLLERARAALLAGQARPCLELLERAGALASDRETRVALHVTRARALAATGAAPELQIESCEAALAVDPSDSAAGGLLVALAAGGGEARARRVVATLERCADSLAGAPQRAVLRRMAAVLGETLHDQAAQLTVLRRAVEQGEGDVELLLELAAAELAGPAPEAADPTLERIAAAVAGQRGPLAARAALLLGEQAEARGDHAAARARYEEAQRRDGGCVPALAALGRLLLAAEEWEAARRLLRVLLLQLAASEHDARRAEVLAQLGRAHAALGERAQAHALFTRALEERPGWVEIEQARAALGKEPAGP